MNEEIGKLLALWILYLSYMVFGALVFKELEYENELIHVHRFKDVLQDIHLKNNVSEAVIVDLSRTFRDAFSMGIDPSTMHQPKWDMAGSFYFVGTVITTIGFGLTAPATKSGQICFLPYALIGIPLNILLFNNLLDLTVQFITYVLHHFHRCWRRSRRKAANQNCHDNPWEPSTLSIAFCCVFAVTVVIFITVPLFVVLEEWTFFESVYFAVVAFTTVGFGDYVPSSAASGTGHNLSPHYKIGSWIVIIVGLIFMYPALAVIASVYKELLNYVARKCRKWNNTRKSNRILASPAADTPTSPSTERKRRLEEEENTKRTAQLVLKNWRSLKKPSNIGPLNTLEASLMRSRLSPAKYRASLDHGPLVDKSSIEGANTIEELDVLESKLKREFKQITNDIQQRKEKLMSQSYTQCDANGIDNGLGTVMRVPTPVSGRITELNLLKSGEEARTSTPPMSEIRASTPPMSEIRASTLPMSEIRASTLPMSEIRASTPPMSEIRASTPPMSEIRASTLPMSEIRASTPPMSEIRASTLPMSEIRVSTPPMSEIRASSLPMSEIRTSTPPTFVIRTSTPTTSVIRTLPPLTSEIRASTPSMYEMEVHIPPHLLD